MLTLLNQAIDKIGKSEIREILIRPCSSHERCGIYIVDIVHKNGKKFADAAYIPISEGKKYIKKQEKKWRGKGDFDGISLSEILTGGECVYCTSRNEKISLEEALESIQKAVMSDKYFSYFKPNLGSLIKLKERLNI